MIIFEKAINVQYQDYLGRLNKKHCSFFFAEPKFPIFQHDERLTHFWMGLQTREKFDILKQMDAIEE